MKKPPKELEDFLKMMMDDQEEENEVKREVGVISKQRIAEIIQIEYEFEDIQEEIDRKMDDYAKNLKREYAPKMFEIDLRQKQFWKNVYSDIGSDGKGKHTLDRKTGVITKKVTPKDLFK